MKLVNKFKGLSAFSLLRAGGWMLGKPFMKRFINNRMPKLPDDHKPAVKEYLYQICALPGSSEYGINYMFNHVVFAINPVVNDVDEL